MITLMPNLWSYSYILYIFGLNLNLTKKMINHSQLFSVICRWLVNFLRLKLRPKHKSGMTSGIGLRTLSILQYEHRVVGTGPQARNKRYKKARWLLNESILSLHHGPLDWKQNDDSNNTCLISLFYKNIILVNACT